VTTTYTPLTVGRGTTGVTFTVRGYGGALVPSYVDLVLETEAGDYLTLESGDYLAYA